MFPRLPQKAVGATSRENWPHSFLRAGGFNHSGRAEDGEVEMKEQGNIATWGYLYHCLILETLLLPESVVFIFTIAFALKANLGHGAIL